jgi:beta-N-acetylglucosaminidase
MKIHTIFDKIIILALIIAIVLISWYAIYRIEQIKVNIENNTAIQLASTITVLRPSFLTASNIDSYLKGTGLYGYGNAFIEAEKQSGIGADYLVSIAIHESGWGSNDWWKYWNNCFSWGITDNGPNSEAYKVKNMSKYDAIVYIAKQIKALYLTRGGAYYKGETLSAIGTYYASDGSWASAVISINANFAKTLTEEVRARQWIMSTRILNGDLPEPQYYTSDYFTRPMTREELSIILYRINGR